MELNRATKAFADLQKEAQAPGAPDMERELLAALVRVRGAEELVQAEMAASMSRVPGQR
jgi:hypothetical protein